jgi:uncharacterized protein DUF1501
MDSNPGIRMDAGRRRTITALAASAAGLAFPSIVRSHGTEPAAWGSMPSSAGTVWNTQPDLRVLEIHLYGGLSMWETFYCRPPTAASPFRGSSMLPFGGCDSAFGDPEPPPFIDAANNPVHLSPITKPLWSTAILDKMRIVVLGHRFEPHEGAIPVALTGFELGSPKLAGLGAAIQHHYAAHDLAAGRPLARPYSYVCWPDAFQFPTDNLQASAATGMHPGYAKPLVMRIGPGTASLLGLLQRTSIRSERDAVLNHYVASYGNQLRHASLASNALARSRGFASFRSSADLLKAAPALNTLLSASTSPLAGPFTQSVACPQAIFGTSATDNMPGHAIRLAAYLLSQTGPDAPRYACVIDKGLREHPSGGGYDTHGSQHMEHTTVNLWNVLATLREQIDLGRIDLNRVMIVLTTEFGRTTGPNRDHWPFGFCNVLIGGPARRGVSGALRDTLHNAPPSEDGRVDTTPAPAPTSANPFPVPHSFSPADLRAAILVAAGIYPFEPEQFAVRDISFASAGSDHYSLMMALKTGVLGAAAGA